MLSEAFKQPASTFKLSMRFACDPTIWNNFSKAPDVFLLVKTCEEDQPVTWDDLGALFEKCPGEGRFCGRFTEGTYDSGCDGAVAGEVAVAPEESGGQLTLPLTGFLPDAAMKLWTTADATDAAVSTG